MTQSETIEVVCPSGLKGVIRPLLVGDISSLSAPANRKASDPLGLLFRSIWQKTLDPGVYAGESWCEEGKAIDRWERVLVGDRAFLVFESRRVTYGNDFYFSVQCRHCRAKFDWHIDLDELETSGLSDEAAEAVTLQSVADAVFYRELPRAGDKVGIRLLTGVHQRIVEKARTEGEGAMSEAALLCRLADVPGVTSPGDRRKFVRQMSLVDLDYLRDEWSALDVHVQDTVEIECPSCDGEQELAIPTDERFFSPRSVKPKRRKR